MASKTIWITACGLPDEKLRQAASRLERYGLRIAGHIWVDDPERFAWQRALAPIVDRQTAAWLIAASGRALATPSIRYGLSLLALGVQARRGMAFPTMILVEAEGADAAASGLPTPLAGAAVIPLESTAMEARITARIHAAGPAAAAAYRLEVHGLEQAGQWFEVGPANGSWEGVMFGAAGAEIDLHAIGPKGSLPQRAVLERPLKGIGLDFDGISFTAWAAANRLSGAESYFVRLSGCPEAIAFGPFSETESADLFMVRLK